MKILAINGSPRKNGNTSLLINMVLDEIKTDGVETEIYQLGGKSIKGCKACLQCFKNMDEKCIISDDCFNECFEKMAAADAIIIGSPTYFANVSAEIKALIDRSGLVAIANNHLFKRKIGASVIAVRRAGATNVLDAINKLFLITQMIVPGSTYWNLGIGLKPGDVNEDEEGKKTMQALGENVSWLLKAIKDQQS